MSVYRVNEVCYRLVHDKPFRAAMQADPRRALADVPELTGAEREALATGDVGTLYLMGAHTFLLGHLQRYKIAGLDVPKYNERLLAAAKGQQAGAARPA